MTRPACSIRFRPAMLVMAVSVALALAGCGRKGGLDAPPGAALEPAAQPAGGGSPAWTGATARSLDPAAAPEGPADTPKGPNKRIILDTLLN